MREYRYSALTAGGQTVSGVRRAGDPDELAGELLQQGLVLLGTKPTFGAWGKLFSPSRRINHKELRDFTQHMATCLGAGITAVSAIADFQETTEGTFREVLNDIKGDVSKNWEPDRTG